jgi:hypothetical protein
VLLLAFFTFPETAYVRDLPSDEDDLGTGPDAAEKAAVASKDVERGSPPPPQKESYLSSLKIFHRTLTNENFFKLVFRPLGLILLPPVLWSALVESVTIGFLVAVTSNVDVAFAAAYDFEAWQVGLCFISACIGSAIGIPAGGWLGDKVADWFTKRNGGVRDPEMRLPAMIPSLITAPLALILYGVGIEKGLHWMCPTVGLGLCESTL